MFRDELELSTTRRFRESKKGNGDISILWLAQALQVGERN